MSLLFFDFEVFKYDWLVVAVDSENRKETVIVNDRERFVEFYNQNKERTWVGYNSTGYDQFIAKSLICDFDPKEVNDWIIVKKKSGWLFSRLFSKIPFYTYDVLTSQHGLKQLEAFMGHNICETSVPFDIDRKLTPEEIQETIKYCRTDVYETIEIFVRRIGEFNSHKGMIDTFKLPWNFISKSVPQMLAHILGAERREYDDEFDVDIPSTLKIEKYRGVVDFFRNAKTDALREMQEQGLDWQDPDEFRKYFYSRGFQIVVAGVTHYVKWGGLHAAIDQYCGSGYYLMIDVTSLYPSLKIEYKYFSRSMVNPQKYIDIYNTNIEMKQTHHPDRPYYKLACNMAYGCLKDKTNPLYDPRMANNICVAGQLFLIDLIEKLEPYCKLIQSNTDGLLLKLDDTDEAFDKVDSVVTEWEERTGLKMEFSEYRKVFQKDVNNYIAVDSEGKVKTKGAYVKKLNDLDNDLPIINKAIVEYLLKGIPPEDTINNCEDFIQFQRVVKVSSKYLCGIKNATFRIENGVKVWNRDGERLTDKTFRVFASTRPKDLGIHKLKTEDARNLEKFANTPEKCFIWNESVNDVKIPPYLDREWYIDLAKKRIRDFGVII